MLMILEANYTLAHCETSPKCFCPNLESALSTYQTVHCSTTEVETANSLENSIGTKWKERHPDFAKSLMSGIDPMSDCVVR